MIPPMALTDTTTPIAELRARLVAFNEEREWGGYHSPRNLAMALTCEAAELLELYLWAKDDGPQPPVPGREARVAEEAADVFISLLNLCAAAGIDLAAATEAKLAKNAVKYPVARARGRAEKWDELDPVGGEEP